jgi:hypothetical protein
MDLKVNSQVVHKDTTNRGSVKVVRVGTILAFADKEKSIAVVSFPAQRTQKRIPVKELSLAGDVFGRSVVQLNPSRRGIGSLIAR